MDTQRIAPVIFNALSKCRLLLKFTFASLVVFFSGKMWLKYKNPPQRSSSKEANTHDKIHHSFSPSSETIVPDSHESDCSIADPIGPPMRRETDLIGPPVKMGTVRCHSDQDNSECDLHPCVKSCEKLEPRIYPNLWANLKVMSADTNKTLLLNHPAERGAQTPLLEAWLFICLLHTLNTVMSINMEVFSYY